MSAGRRAVKILLIYKSSEDIRKNESVSGRDAASFRLSYRRHQDSLRIVEAALRRRDVEWTASERARNLTCRPFDLVVTVGGDGTFLEAARRIQERPVLGVNSNPDYSVGEFCSTDAGGFAKLLDRFLASRHRVRVLPRLRIILNGTPRPLDILNEVLVCHANPARMSRYRLRIGPRTEDQFSSGVWISTAPGSSGALFSAGGRRLPKESPLIQYRPRELYHRRGRPSRLKGGILKSPGQLSMVSLMSEGMIYADGDAAHFRFGYSDTLRICRSPYPLRIIN